MADADAPREVVEAALFNLSTLRSPTVFQTADGEFYGWEGVGDRTGSCYGTCTHVWGYEFATSLLFAPIARSFRRTQFARCTDDDGLMSFRAGLPAAEYSQTWDLAAADGQMACLVHLYLDWKLSGDDDFLAALWPAARRALEFCWIPGGWDADRDGVMEGVQHNTMDVEYYGPESADGFVVPGRAAGLRGDGRVPWAKPTSRATAGSCSERVAMARRRAVQRRVLPARRPRCHATRTSIARGLRHRSMGAVDTIEPDLQLADGCLVDQLVGQYAAKLVGLGDLLDPNHVRDHAC